MLWFMLNVELWRYGDMAADKLFPLLYTAILLSYSISSGALVCPAPLLPYFVIT